MKAKEVSPAIYDLTTLVQRVVKREGKPEAIHACYVMEMKRMGIEVIDVGGRR